MATMRIAFAVCFLISFTSLPHAQGISSCVNSTTYNSSTNYFPDANASSPFAIPIGDIAVDTAMDFAVGYKNSYKLVKNNFANTAYVIYLCGSPKPTVEDFGTDARFFEAPLATFGVDTTVPLTYLEFLGVIPQMARAATDFIQSPCLQKLVKNQNVLQLEDPYFGDSAVFAKQSAKLAAVISAQETPSIISKIVSFDASTDPGPLKRAEWIKFLALFFNKETRANEVYSTIEKLYQCQNGSSPADSTPVAAWVNFYDGNWTVSQAAYKLQLTSDAGGVNLQPSQYRSYNITYPGELAAFQAVLKDLDIVIDETYAAAPTEYSFANFTSLAHISASDIAYKFLATKAVWRQDKRSNAAGGLDWLESAIAEPHVVLRDLLTMFHGGSTATYYFRNIAKGESGTIQTADDCKAADPSAQREPTVISCPYKAAAPTPSSPDVAPPPPKEAAPAPQFTALAVTLAIVGLAAILF